MGFDGRLERDVTALADLRTSARAPTDSEVGHLSLHGAEQGAPPIVESRAAQDESATSLFDSVAGFRVCVAVIRCGALGLGTCASRREKCDKKESGSFGSTKHGYLLWQKQDAIAAIVLVNHWTLVAASAATNWLSALRSDYFITGTTVDSAPAFGPELGDRSVWTDQHHQDRYVLAMSRR